MVVGLDVKSSESISLIPFWNTLKLLESIPNVFELASVPVNDVWPLVAINLKVFINVSPTTICDCVTVCDKVLITRSSPESAVNPFWVNEFAAALTV